MKQTILSLVALLITCVGMAQSDKYGEAMKQHLEQLSKAKTPEELGAVSAGFERIARAEKNQWLPFYYAALAQARMGFEDKKADKDNVAQKIASLIEAGEAINRNAEFYTLRYMNATLKLLVNPMVRWQTNGAEAETAFKEGLKMDDKNPRLYFLKGQTIANTPAMLGGGKDAAKPLFEKAVAVSKGAAQTDQLLPSWGVEEARKALQ